MTNESIIEELNTFLRGTYMGIRSLEHYIQKVDDLEIKRRFQGMQQGIKLDAQKIAERIQNLSGVPADDEGFSGSIHSYMHKMIIPDDTKEMIKDALKGIDGYGVEYSEELLKGDLDPESKLIVEEVIEHNRNHVELLRQLLH